MRYEYHYVSKLPELTGPFQKVLDVLANDEILIIAVLYTNKIAVYTECRRTL